MIDLIIYGISSLIIVVYILHEYYFNGPKCKSKNRLDSKVVIITGANCGIGYETALDLIKRGAIVVMACRDLKKANEAADKIKLETNTKNVYVEQLDLASLNSIKDFSEKFKKNFNKLDILINNAGLSGIPYQKTKDGFETQFGTMHLGHFYLTNLLIELLKSSATSRIINVTSVGHFGVKMNWDDLQSEKNYSHLFAYRQAKLANVLFTTELARRYKNEGITSVCLHPGGVRTEIWRGFQNSGLFDIKYYIYVFVLVPLFYLYAKDCKMGAQTTIHCAVADDIPEHNGGYFDNCKLAKCSKEGINVENAKKLWDISEKLVGIE